MKVLHAALTLFGLLVTLPATAAPKHILLTDSLLANSDPWDVSQGAELMGTSKWRFGEYAVVAKQGWTTGGSWTNLFGTKTENQAATKFSSVVNNPNTDSAFVLGAHVFTSKSNPGLDLGNGSFVGGDGRTVEADRFMASITLNGDTTVWTLSIRASDVSDRQGESIEGRAAHAATLTSGERRIVLNPVFSKKLAKSPSILSQVATSFRPPAMGYEFVEDGRSLCAVEYFSSGLAGSAKNTIWLDRNIDQRMRLLLAAAMTAVLQLQSARARAPAEPDHK